MVEYKEEFLHRQAIINAAVEAVLGKDYYNYCCDSWSCTEMCMEDILYKLPHGTKYVKKYREIMAQKNKELEERYGKEMQKYDIRVGDYIETKNGEKGYVYSFVYKDEYYQIDAKYRGYKKRYFGKLNVLYSTFNRIGQYDFTEPQKQNKIEPLPIDVKYENKSCDKATTYANGNIDIKFDTKENIITGIKDIPNYDIYNKINEIIDYINSKED